jgi:hypothetical protein
MRARRLWPFVVVAAACAIGSCLGACLFPSLDTLSASDAAIADAALDDEAVDANPVDASDGGCANADPTLVAYYSFDEGSGTTIHDCSTHGFDAVLTSSGGGDHWTTGHSGHAILFDSSSSVCVIVNSSGANQFGALTLSAWVMLLDPNGGYVVGQRTTSGYGWRIDMEPTDAGADLGFAIGVGDGANDFSAATITSGSKWHHVAAVFDPVASTQTLFFDGTPFHASPAATAIVADPTPTTIRIGCRGDDTQFFDGVIDEVRIYSRALSPTEITALASE